MNNTEIFLSKYATKYVVKYHTREVTTKGNRLTTGDTLRI